MSVTTMEMARPSHAVETFRTDIGVAGWASSGEDRVLVRPDLGLYGVFDGVGVSGRGGPAAQAAVVAVERAVEAGLPHCRSQHDAEQLLVSALEAGDAAVHALNTRRPRGATGGGATSGGEPAATTATVVLLVSGADPAEAPTAVVASVGDSRVQLVRAAQLRTVTLDHGMFADAECDSARQRQDRLDEAMCVNDLTDPMDRAAFNRRNMLSAALTGDGDLDVRTYVEPLQAGDRLAIDSDGVHDNLRRSELCVALRTDGAAQDVADAVASHALERAGEGTCPTSTRSKQDDISVIVVTVGLGLGWA